MIRERILIFAVFYLVHCIGGSPIPLLINSLFRDSDYNKYAQPSKPLQIGLMLQMEEIKEIDDVHETLVSRVRTHMFWKDTHLKWDKSQYQGLTSVMVPQDLVWKPDIGLLNGVTEVQTIGNSYTPVKLYYRGQNQWSPVNIFQTKCHFDLEYYPYDSQKCEIYIGAIASSNYHIELPYLECTEPEHMLQTSTWRLLKVEKSVRENAMRYHKGKRQTLLVCKYFLQRKSSYYFTNILLPLIFLGIMNPIAFLIPYDSGERISFSMTLFLAFAVFLTILMEKVPVDSDKTSYLQIYLICQLAITAFILVFTAFRIRLLTVGSEAHRRNAVAPKMSLDSIYGHLQAWKKQEKVDKPETVNEKRRRCVVLGRRIRVIVREIKARIDIFAFLLVCIMQITCTVWFFASVKTGSNT